MGFPHLDDRLVEGPYGLRTSLLVGATPLFIGAEGWDPRLCGGCAESTVWIICPLLTFFSSRPFKRLLTDAHRERDAGVVSAFLDDGLFGKLELVRFTGTGFLTCTFCGVSNVAIQYGLCTHAFQY